MEEFAGINRAMEKTGTFTMHRKKLFQLVGKANSNLADVILRVGLFDRYSVFLFVSLYMLLLIYKTPSSSILTLEVCSSILNVLTETNNVVFS